VEGRWGLPELLLLGAEEIAEEAGDRTECLVERHLDLVAERVALDVRPAVTRLGPVVGPHRSSQLRGHWQVVGRGQVDGLVQVADGGVLLLGVVQAPGHEDVHPCDVAGVGHRDGRREVHVRQLALGGVQ